MDNVTKLILIGLGGFIVYNLTKKSKLNKIAIQNKDIPYSQQPIEIQMGDHLTLAQKEEFIMNNGKLSLFVGEGMSSADGFTDNLILESAIKKQSTLDGLGLAMTDLTPRNVLIDSRCAINKMRKLFDYSDWDSVYGNIVNSMYVIVKCQIAKANGDIECEETEAVERAAEMSRNASDKMKALSYNASMGILEKCRSIRKKEIKDNGEDIQNFAHMVATSISNNVDQ